MLALLLAAAPPSFPPAAACTAADPAVTSLTSQRYKKRGSFDHYVITATVTNVGAKSQTPDVAQKVELVRDGRVLAPQNVPSLGAGVAYRLAFAVDRPVDERGQPLTVTVRYLLTSGNPARDACNRANDEITKTF